MSRQPLEQLEPLVQQHSSRRVSRSFQKIGLDSIATAEVLVLATAIAHAVVDGLEMRERRKFYRLLALTACGLAALIGTARFAVRFIQ